MRRFALIGFGLGLASLGTWALLRGGASKLLPRKPLLRVALVGDSHSQALFPRLRGPILSAHPDRRIVLEESRPGWSLKRYMDDGVLDRLRAAAPDLVVVSLGGNDRPASDPAFSSRVQAFLTQLRQMGVRRVVWNGPADTAPNASTTVARAHDQVRDLLDVLLADEEGVVFFDAYPVTASGHRDDGVHFPLGPTGGYAIWAGALQQFVPLA